MRLAFLTRNLSIKLFALVVALLLFLFVSVESATPIDVEFPMEYRTADDIMITSDAPRKLHATLRGPWAAFGSLILSELEPVVIDVSQGQPGTVRHRIENEDVNPPAGMAVVSIRPPEVELSLDRRVEKMVTVQVDPLGRPAFGFEIVGMRAEPTGVRVIGPATRMQTLDFVFTEPVPLGEREENLMMEVGLRAPAAPLRLSDRTSVTVFVDIREEFLQRNLTLPVRLANAPTGTRFVPDAVTITLRGPRRIVDKLDRDSIEAVIDVGPEAQDNVRSFAKAVTLVPGKPDRTEVVGLMPKVEVILPHPSKRRR